MTSPSWSRYGSRLRRLCARAGCNAPAVATLRFEPTERLAWLAELDESAARTQGDLCQRHAAALVLPRGWELHDERVVERIDAVDADDVVAIETAVDEAPVAAAVAEPVEVVESVDVVGESVDAPAAAEPEIEAPAEV